VTGEADLELVDLAVLQQQNAVLTD